MREEKKLKEYLNNWKRTQADFINYKRDETERISDSIKYIKEEMLFKILPILDNIEIAEKEMPSDLKENQWVKGLLLVKCQIKDFLKTYGVEEIKSEGGKFNPNFHEAVEEIEGKESGLIIEEVKKGYILNNKVLRPAKVKITK